MILPSFSSDRRKMVAYVGCRVADKGQRIVLATGPDGEVLADVCSAWDQDDGWDVSSESNLPEWVGLREIYDHFRRQDMTSWEWRAELEAEIHRAKATRPEDQPTVRSPTTTNRQRGPRCSGAGHDLDHAEFLSVKDAAVVTSLSHSYLRRAIYSREIPAANIGSQARPVWRISRKDLVAWLETRKGGSSSIPPKSQLRDLIQRHLPGL